MDATVQSIFTEHFPTYCATHKVPLHKHKAVRAMIDCRTAKLGGHVQRCPHGHVEQVWYNSCKHRACPQCGALPTERWLDMQKARMLACDHYHAIFTQPHQLNDLWWCNNRLMVGLLFHSAIDTLMELLKDKRYLGALPGIIASLHTWGRNLSQHPHLHCLITGGGWTDAGWKPVTGGYLLPFAVVRTLFRGKYIAALRQAYQAGDLHLPTGMSAQQFENLLNKLGRKVKWNVHIRERYAHGEGVMTYLSRYVKGGPINNTQLRPSAGDRITFQYTDHRDHRIKPLSLPPEQFIQRLLWHIPESGQHTIRYYGLYGHQKQERRNQCREHLGQPPETKPKFLEWQTYWERQGKTKHSHCNTCGERLVPGAILPRLRGPPKVLATAGPVWEWAGISI
jgi:hypothetical protein